MAMAVEILHGVDIMAAPETVFDAITTSKGEAGFWTADSSAEPVVGSVARFGFPGTDMVVRMEVQELETGRRVVWSCQGEFPYWEGTTITWELEPPPPDAGTAGTRLVFRHSGFSDEYAGWIYASVNFTWGQVIGRLRAYAETGEPQPYFP
jgi:uncharacterized protein YndB with AHSA1/START domain